MAKGIRERLLEQAIKFHQWQEATYPGKTSEELGGEWEVDYPYWNDTYSAFCHVLTQVDVELPVTEPPETLYHGTARRFAASIEAQGLLPQSRLYVHLSPDQETAEKVGRRHGEPVIYLVDAGQMHRDGYCFYLSANGVWLTKVVPATYLKRLEGELKQH